MNNVYKAKDAGARLLTRPIIGCLIGISVFGLALTFLTILNRDEISSAALEDALLAGRNIRSAADLEQEARLLGFTPGPRWAKQIGVGIEASVGQVSWDANGLLEFFGYAFDYNRAGNPVSVYLIMNGHAVAMAQARGERRDITGEYVLPHAIGANVLIHAHAPAPISCEQVNGLLALVLTRKNEFIILEPRKEEVLFGCGRAVW